MPVDIEPIMVRLEKMMARPSAEHNPHPPRTNSIEGLALTLPEVGRTMDVFGEPLDEGATLRHWTTSRITEVAKAGKGKYIFKTRNTVYRLSVL